MLPNNIKTTEQLHRFIGGRRRYNAWRKFRAMDRRWQLLYFWAKHPQYSKADLAHHFGVSKSTITRDIQAMRRQESRYHQCPLCAGKGRLDTGPGIATTVELVSDLERKYKHLTTPPAMG